VHIVRSWRLTRDVYVAPEPVQANALAGSVTLAEASALR